MGRDVERVRKVKPERVKESVKDSLLEVVDMNQRHLANRLTGPPPTEVEMERNYACARRNLDGLPKKKLIEVIFDLCRTIGTGGYDRKSLDSDLKESLESDDN